MREIADELQVLLAQREPFATAIIARTWRSSPRPVGTFMAVTGAGAAIGSLSGGCIEGAVYETSLQTIEAGGSVSTHYGVSGEDALRVGLTCGGEIDVTISRVDPGDPGQAEPLRVVQQALAEQRAVVFIQRVDTRPGSAGAAGLGRWVAYTGGDSLVGSLGSAQADERALSIARGTLGIDGQYLDETATAEELLVCSWAPSPRLIVFGAIDFARAVVRLGKFLDYRVTVCDARPVFATPERFPEADELVVKWPHRWLAGEVEAGRVAPNTVILVLTHDPKFDIPALQVALRCGAAFVGALGSRKTTRDREAALREAGMTDEELSRLHAPVGLDISAETPEETAVSIMGQVIAARSGAPGGSLVGGDESIHRNPTGEVRPEECVPEQGPGPSGNEAPSGIRV
ncbi:XdhC family protein [Tessaracoccus sp. SD287]|uniref:XdhC family protein n=1 Tax=Tessaracoccus sp. SD287 TaxID=2782008 RepID=UPI001A96091F|nr:XdhC/CoxI family protein [Tessaracoccus sp. SD287]MBO1030732.1 XdhC family protein [Tessaracoccus sp. SD287]